MTSDASTGRNRRSLSNFISVLFPQAWSPQGAFWIMAGHPEAPIYNTYMMNVAIFDKDEPRSSRMLKRSCVAVVTLKMC